MLQDATEHTALEKGGAYMDVEVYEVHLHPVTRKVSLKRVRRAMFVSSLPFSGTYLV